MNTWSWGRLSAPAQTLLPLEWRHLPLPLEPGRRGLPYGLGRSYGDSCLNSEGVLLDTARLSHLLAFDRATGVVQVEGGVTLGALIDLALPHGFFLPVTPGTKFVTVGGAIANDVHGKNHHRAGTFGSHVLEFELLRSDGSRLVCSREQHKEWFAATVGGLGLTGLITWAKVQLKALPGPLLEVETLPFRGVQAFFDLSDASDRDWDYTVAWIDCVSTGRDAGRGVLFRGNPHASAGDSRVTKPALGIPVNLPSSLLSPVTVRALNSAYFALHESRRGRALQHFEPFFYPLDQVRDWNRGYGSRGFYQYQFVLPLQAREMVGVLLDRIARSGQASFLAVLKMFGSPASPGMMSFPMPGVTLALDFANQGERTLALMRELDALVLACGGRLYPAKDARMSALTFQRMYPQWRQFAAFVDEGFSSDFWRRVTPGEGAHA